MSEDNDAEMNWLTVEAPPGKKIPAWTRSAAITKDGTIYLPVAICGDENRAMMAATWDGGVPFLQRDGHLYLPADWMAQEYTREAENIQHIAERVRQLASQDLSTPEDPSHEQPD
jgi:hypothetical protein